MKIQGVYLWLALTFFSQVAVGGEEKDFPVSPSFQEVLREVLERNAGLHSARAGADAARERVDQADVLPEPQLGITRFGESVQTRTGPQETIFSLNQKFPWWGTLDRKANVASAQARASEYSVRSLERQLTKSTARIFYEIAYTDKAIDLTGENLNLLQKLEPVVQAKVEGGGHLNALLRLKVETGTLSDALASLKQRRNILSARLGALLNLEANSGIGSPAWEAPDMQASLPSEVSGSVPDLLSLEARRDAAASQVVLSKLAGYPSLMVGANYIQVGDPEVNPSTPDAGRDPWNVMAAISIPLWRGAIKAEQAEARSLKQQAELTLIQTRNDLQAELSSARAARADAHRRMTLYGSELLDLAEQAAENSRTAYEAGQTGILEVIDSERSLLDLQRKYWRAAADAHIQRILIQTLTAHPKNYGTTKGTKITEELPKVPEGSP